MAKVKWTKEQESAIYEKGNNILVAAAAGSGKTAVLVERIINKVLNDNVDIDKLLIVTFTNAAAAEMKERILNTIYQKLEEEPENKRLQRQIILLNKASICTIDSFCLDVVRNNFFELKGISPNFRIADTSELEILKLEVLEELFEEKYEQNDNSFLKLINTYTSYRDDTPLKEMILKIHSYTQSNPFPEKWLNEHIEMYNIKNKLEQDFSNTPWGKILLEDAKQELIDDIVILKDIHKSLQEDEKLEKFEQTIAQDIKQLEILQNNLENWDKSFEIYSNINFSTWPRNKVESEIKEEAKKIRDDVKKKLSGKLNKIFICNSKTANEDIYSTYNTLKNLEDLILEFQTKFFKKKREKNIVDFNDIEHLALELLLRLDENGKLVETQVAKKYQEKYEEIAIDEYQDSNLVQEYIMGAVSKKNNIFMVGDVKQSIYKFRQAMPELFLSKYYKYSNISERKKGDNLKIQLFKNFRSRENVLNFTNIIFENIMSKDLGDVDYTKEEFLNLGAEDYEDLSQDLKAEIDIIDIKEDDETNINSYEKEDQEEQIMPEERIENIELEARFVANKIKDLIKNKYQVFDRKTKKFRNITYKDIVILLRSTKDKANVFEREIIKLNMPVFSDTSQAYLDSIEIETVMSVLKVIDNPIQDIPLVTVLRSSIGNFNDNELMTIRLTDKQDNFYTAMKKAQLSVDNKLREKINSFLNQLDTWRKEKEYLALDELIWKIIYVDTNFYNDVLKMPNGILKQENLKMLFERAKQYEKVSFKGVFNFIKFIDKIKLSSGDLGSAKLIGENDNVIRIMSIHKSKGLEFPVVFLANTGKQFNMQDVKQDAILLNQDLGIGAKYIDYDLQVEYDTLTRAAVKNKIINENISEEMRVLYVALTRAKEKLFVTSVLTDAKKHIEDLKVQKERYSKSNNKINTILIKKCKTYIDWIILVGLYEKGNIEQISNFNVLKKRDIMQELKNTNIENVKTIETENKPNKKEEETNNIWEYSYIIDTIIPTKTSVTKLKQANIDTINSQINLAKPEFLKESEQIKLTSAQKGTLIHLCMQHLNEKEEYDINKVKELINSLKLKGIITDIEAQNINPNSILEFTRSEIFEQLKQAKEINKEKPFYITIPANQIDEKYSSQEVLVQGIIDLYYTNKENELVLVDYKTDYIENGNEEELISKYKTQLDLYRRALEEALRRKVDKTYIYSVYLGKILKIG